MNTGFRSSDKPSKTADFMPSQWAKQPTSQAVPTTEDHNKHLLSAMRMFFVKEGHTCQTVSKSD